MSSTGRSFSPSPTLVEDYVIAEDEDVNIDWAAISAVQTLRDAKPSKLPIPCKNFNKDACLCPTSCPHPHICSSCRQTDHSALHCIHGSRRNIVPGRSKRGFTWDDDTSFSPCSQASLKAPPFPRPPPEAKLPRNLVETVRGHPEVFKVVTPINVDVLEGLTSSHPNKAHVKSICRGFREGFWPFAGIPHDKIVDESYRQKRGQEPSRKFLENQRDEEIAAGRFSASIGRRLYPGMTCMPVHVGKKQGNKKFRLINDHSAGDYSLNALIPEKERSAQVDDIQSLMRMIHERRLNINNTTLFKSDVSSAFRVIPLHPYWQALQAVKIDGEYYVDRCNTFGNAASQRIFCAFFSLVLWIAENIFGIPDILSYVDDNFSWEYSSRKRYYAPYNKTLPDKQTRLLQLWDMLGIPHAAKKQEFGSTLTIIGFTVDLRRMRVSVPTGKMEELVTTITGFCDSKPRVGHARSLQDCRKLAGLVNWTFDINPLLLPGIRSLHKEMARVDQAKPQATLFFSERIRSDLNWLACLLRKSKGIPFIKSGDWGVDDASRVIYTDASSEGFTLWSPTTNDAFRYRFMAETPASLISAGHVFAIICAIYWAKSQKPHSDRLMIFSSDRSTVTKFDQLCAPEETHHLLLLAIEMLIEGEIDLHVVREESPVTARLSRDSRENLEQDYPLLKLKEFNVPEYIMDRARCIRYSPISDSDSGRTRTNAAMPKPRHSRKPKKSAKGAEEVVNGIQPPSHGVIRSILNTGYGIVNYFTGATPP